jgi:NAD(P)-dependent dehydrogenase (short-subunit alcohol dehydrogenase family)
MRGPPAAGRRPAVRPRAASGARGARGAARGLGAEIARQAHDRGADVALVGRRRAPLEALAAQLGDRAAAFEADVSDLAALTRAAEATVERFGGIDVVVANAGIAPPSDTVLTIDPAAFERTVDIDLLGQWRTVRATLPALIERQGHVLVVASIYAFFNGALNASYAASKAGVEQLTRALRVELAPHGVSAGVAYLGFIQTDLAADVFEQAQVAQARRRRPRSLPRRCRPTPPGAPCSTASNVAPRGSARPGGCFRCWRPAAP